MEAFLKKQKETVSSKSSNDIMYQYKYLTLSSVRSNEVVSTLELTQLPPFFSTGREKHLSENRQLSVLSWKAQF